MGDVSGYLRVQVTIREASFPFISYGHYIRPSLDRQSRQQCGVLEGQEHSAAESFAFDLFDSGRVTVIGEPTFGCSGGGPRLFATRGGILFRLPTRGLDMSASGLPMIGVGLQPHIHIAPTLQDIASGVDAALLAAIEHLRTNATILH